MDLTEARIANLENLRKTGMVVLNVKDSRKDIFSKEYQQALTAINCIVKESMSEVKQQPFAQESGWLGFCEDDPCADSANRQNISLHRINTLISFIGNRGTGKTSAMLTVLHQLQTLQCRKELDFSLQPLTSSSFICLEPIDAGILQSGEDIIEIVLARMFNFLQQRTNGNNLRARYQEELRSLYREFDKLYQNLCRLRNGGHFLEGESALRELQNLASSHSTAREFKNLVWHLLTYTKILNGCEKDQYLVIALDDIDMYGQSKSHNCYTLLEEIFDYLSFPGIIVLATYNETLLKRNCSNHLREKFFENRKSSECSSTERTEVKTLVQQFLEKLIIEEYRIYMPMLARVDVSNQVGMSVRLGANKEPGLCSLFGDCTHQNAEVLVPVKQFLLRIIADRTNVYFDSRGKKRHFFEPYNLRDLSVFLRMLESLDSPTGKDGREREKSYANNRKKLFSYTMNPFASEKLEEGEGAYLSRLSQQPLERQERELIDDIKRRCQSQENRTEIRTFLEGRWQHSYGELLHCLYYATRLPENGMSKELIYCILSNYSLILNQLYFAPDFKAGGESHKIFSQFVGSSIAGAWVDDMLPKLRRDIELTGSLFYSFGFINSRIYSLLGWNIDANVVHELFGLSPVSKDTESYSPNFQNAKEFVQALELLFMLFNSPQGESLQIELCIQKDEKTNAEVYILNSTQSTEICFDVLNFVVNCLDVNYYFDEFKTLFSKTVTRFVFQQAREEIEQRKKEKFIANGMHIVAGIKTSDPMSNPASVLFRRMRDAAKIKNQIDWQNTSDEEISIIINEEANIIINQAMKKVDRFSLRKEFASWAERTPLALPLQNFDMMYNIIKRLANSNYYGNDIPGYIEVDEAFGALQKLYESFTKQLEDQDKFYSNSVELKHTSFEASYTSCPFYKHFVKKPSAQLKKLFTEVIKSVAKRKAKDEGAQIPSIRISDVHI